MTKTHDHNFSYQKSKAAVVKTPTEHANQRIEDRLIEFGQESKKKKEMKYIEKIREESSKYDFKPKINSTKYFYMEKYGGNNFLERMEYLNCTHKENLENLKMKNRIERDTSEYTFHPKIDSKLKDYKRSFNDLFVKFTLIKKRNGNSKTNKRKDY